MRPYAPAHASTSRRRNAGRSSITLTIILTRLPALLAGRVRNQHRDRNRNQDRDWRLGNCILRPAATSGGRCGLIAATCSAAMQIGRRPLRDSAPNGLGGGGGCRNGRLGARLDLAGAIVASLVPFCSGSGEPHRRDDNNEASRFRAIYLGPAGRSQLCCATEAT